MERLTIKELAPYATHELRIKLPNGKIKKLKSIDFELSILNFGWKDTVYLKDEIVLPLLRPLSQLTEEIEHNGERFNPKDRLRKISGAFGPDEELKNPFNIHIVDGFVTGFSALCMHVNQLELFNKLHEWHFDTANLLGRNLALPIDGKEVEGE